MEHSQKQFGSAPQTSNLHHSVEVKLLSFSLPEELILNSVTPVPVRPAGEQSGRSRTFLLHPAPPQTAERPPEAHQPPPAPQTQRVPTEAGKAQVHSPTGMTLYDLIGQRELIGPIRFISIQTAEREMMGLNLCRNPDENLIKFANLMINTINQ